MRLYGYFRSSAAYRVRIAIALKGLACEMHPVNLVASEQQADAYRDINPQALVPALMLDSGEVISQSMAILEWLEESHPQPALYARDPIRRAGQRSLCQHIACDIHPLNNLRVLHYLRETLGQAQETIDAWYRHWIRTGFEALEPVLAAQSDPFSLGERPGMVEALLVPQVYNARRFAVELDPYPAIRALDARCNSLDAFRSAHPHRQPDTPEALRDLS